MQEDKAEEEEDRGVDRKECSADGWVVKEVKNAVTSSL
jgi:hypothetical protein